MKAGSGLLRDRDLLLLFTARTASLTGNVIAPLGLAFAVLALPDGTPTQLGLLLSIRTIAGSPSCCWAVCSRTGSRAAA